MQYRSNATVIQEMVVTTLCPENTHQISEFLEQPFNATYHPSFVRTVWWTALYGFCSKFHYFSAVKNLKIG